MPYGCRRLDYDLQGHASSILILVATFYRSLGPANYGQDDEIACPYLNPYMHNARFLDKQYGIRREDHRRFMIGHSVLTVDDTSDISINGRHFKGTRGLWELLTRKNITRGVVTTDDLTVDQRSFAGIRTRG